MASRGEIVIECDGCGGEFILQADDVRMEPASDFLKSEGWVLQNDRDICDQCRDEIPEA